MCRVTDAPPAADVCTRRDTFYRGLFAQRLRRRRRDTVFDRIRLLHLQRLASFRKHIFFDPLDNKLRAVKFPEKPMILPLRHFSLATRVCYVN